ncbi:MAG TPA: lytic transglycosylase domain-containing protein [Bacteroidales bacterium]|nr:lytic transglycosylase domain-containing protein [Bacteroidales bacterium]
MKKRIVIIVALLTIAGVHGFYLLRNNSGGVDDDNYRKALMHSNKVFSLVLPASVEFAGEEAPLSLYYVREGLDRELTVNTYWHSSTILMLKKAARYFPTIIPILKSYGIPEDFKYLVLIESGLTNVVSPAGAAGFWQFLPETGKRYGLEINDEVDERYHVEKATLAACKMLKDSKATFKNWTLAAAAYNAGESKIMKELERQKVDNYYDLFLNSETSRYIYRLLAIKLLYEHPTQFGFYIRNKDQYPPIPTYRVKVDSTVSNLIDFAKHFNINYRVLKEFNPWLRKDKLTNTARKQYTFLIPKPGYRVYDSLVHSIDNGDMIFNDTITLGTIR